MAATIAFARLGGIDWAALNCVGWFLYDFADATIKSVPEWETKSLQRDLRGDSLPRVIHANVAQGYGGEFRDAGMSREFAETA